MCTYVLGTIVINNFNELVYLQVNNSIYIYDFVLYMSTKAYVHKLFRNPDVITSTIDGLKGAEEVWEFPYLCR